MRFVSEMIESERLVEARVKDNAVSERIFSWESELFEEYKKNILQIFKKWQ